MGRLSRLLDAQKPILEDTMKTGKSFSTYNCRRRPIGGAIPVSGGPAQQGEVKHMTKLNRKAQRAASLKGKNPYGTIAM